MKRPLSSALFAALGLALASSSFGAAAPKSGKSVNRSTSALVAALQAVSPDPLGGRLGLDITARTTSLKIAPAHAPLVAQPAPAGSKQLPAIELNAAPKS